MTGIPAAACKVLADVLLQVGQQHNVLCHLSCRSDFGMLTLTVLAGACEVLADVLMQAGQRAVLGKVRNLLEFPF